jgi:hypothetical protein
MLSQTSKPAPRTTTADGDSHSFDDVLSRTRGPRWRDRLDARLRRSSLDRELIAGADPCSSLSLAARAHRLSSARDRAALSDGLDRAVLAATGPQRRWWAVPRRGAVRENIDDLSALGELLRSGRPLYARGVAIVHELLTDGSGPFYTGDAALLQRRIREARAAMID